jgi:HAMP domain-containing protein
MSALLTAAMLVAGLAFFAFTMTRRLAPLAALRKDVR